MSLYLLTIVLLLLTSVKAEVTSLQCEDPYPQLSTNKTCFTRSTCPKPGHPLMETSALMDGGILERNCMCDRLCVVYGDCCDVIYKLIHAGREPWMESHLDLPSLPDNSFSCISVSQKRMYEVNKCPPDWQDSFIKEKCETTHVPPDNNFLEWPVSDYHGIRYRNMYCAHCHQVPHFLYWKIDIQCNQKIDETMMLSKDDFDQMLSKCEKRFEPPNIQISFRPCKSFISTCPYDWFNDSCNIRQKCEDGPNSYVYNAEHRKLTYRNKYCAKCNFDNDVVCDDGEQSTKETNAFTYPFSIILDINVGDGSASGQDVGQRTSFVHNKVSEMKTCSNDKVYDVDKGICRSIYCGEAYIWQNGTCVKITSSNDTVFVDTDCIRISLNQSEFMIYENSSLHVLASAHVHQKGSYEITQDGLALVCTNFTKNYTVATAQQINLKFNKAQSIMTLVGQIISLLGLLIQLVVYSMFAKLRNLAGKCLMSLATGLFCGQLFFLIARCGEGNYVACTLLAILTHYAFLASFAWMNIMSYDIWKTFASTTKPQALDHQGRRFIKYCFFGWGGPLCLTLVAIIVNFTTSDTVYRPGYGETICWIRYRSALLIFFAAPVALVVLANLIFYVLTVINIWKISKLAQTVTKKSDKKQLWLYIKLSSIMGLTWIFGFVAAIFDSQTLWYFFIIFNSLHGVFICISFVFTKQVYHLMRDTFRPVYMALSSTATTSTTVSESQHLSKLPVTDGTRRSDDALDKGNITSVT